MLGIIRLVKVSDYISLLNQSRLNVSLDVYNVALLLVFIKKFV